jgi:hypothetical protein
MWCSGSGAQRCWICFGSGRCSHCSGRGRTTCYRCGGRGQVSEPF